MSNALYAKGKEKFLTGAIDLSSATIKAILLSSSYTPNLSTHEFLSDVNTYRLNSDQTLTSKTTTAGVFDAADISFTAVTTGSTARYIALYKDTGVAGTSPLLVLIDTITGFPYTTNGGDVNVNWDNGANKIFAL